MNLRRSLLAASVIKPFYREKAGLLIFVYYIMFLAVGKANGVALKEYHYSLIRGMLNDTTFLLSVFAAWSVYASMCSQFVVRTFRKPEFAYLNMLLLLDPVKLYVLLLSVHAILFAPVLSYVIVILAVGYCQHWHVTTTAVLFFNLLIVPLLALRAFYIFRKPGKVPFRIRWKLPSVFQRKFYVSFLIRYMLEQSKGILLVTKVYTCGILYMMFEDRVPSNETDLRMIVLFYFFGLLGHGVIIHRLKEVENTRLTFYRSMPVPILYRFFEYAIFYLLLFVPELLLIVTRTPSFITYFEATYFLFFGYGTLLLLNSLQLFNYTGIRDYLKIILQIFIVFLLSLISNTHFQFSIIVFVIAIVLFFSRYYNFEPHPDNVMR